MESNQIITSVLDNDLYNFHMGEFAYHHYRDAMVKYTYWLRDTTINLKPILPEFRKQIEMMSDLVLQPNEAEYLVKNTRCSEAYAEHLTKTRVFDPSDINITEYPQTFALNSEGIWCDRIYREVTCMSIIAHLYFKNLYGDKYDDVLDSGKRWLADRIMWCNGNAHELFKFMEFGTRRRFSLAWQEYVLVKLWEEIPQHIVGTSNVHLAMKHNIPCFGTMAHQLFMFMQTTTHIQDSQRKTLDEWTAHFGSGVLGTALTDTLGDAKWDVDFTKERMGDFTGERNDSGNPYKWGEARLESASKNGLDPTNRILQFSNNLDDITANKLNEHFADKCKLAPHGMGTFWTCSMGYEGHKPVNQVMKLTWAKPFIESEWRPTCKLSADETKAQCEDMNYLAYVKHNTTTH
jgi:nicotinate phosphoribosyltransferase